MEIQRDKERISKTVAILDRNNEPSLPEDLANYDTATVKESTPASSSPRALLPRTLDHSTVAR
jgi:hypothetical protein